MTKEYRLRKIEANYISLFSMWIEFWIETFMPDYN